MTFFLGMKASQYGVLQFSNSPTLQLSGAYSSNI